MSEPSDLVTLSDVEAAVWRLLGERGRAVGARRVAELMTLVERLAVGSQAVDQALLVEGGAKRCRECGLIKLVDQYHVDRYQRDGRRAQCRDCVNAKRRRRERAVAEARKARIGLLRDVTPRAG